MSGGQINSGILKYLFLCFTFSSFFCALPDSLRGQDVIPNNAPQLKELIGKSNFILSKKVLEFEPKDLEALKVSLRNFLNYASNMYASSSLPPSADTFDALSNANFFLSSDTKKWTTEIVPAGVKLLDQSKFLKKAGRRKNSRLSFTTGRAYRISNVLFSKNGLFGAVKVSAADMIFTQKTCRTWFVFYVKGANGWYVILSQGSECI